MSLRSHAYPVDLIRSCEQVLLDAQSAPDQLMRQAAHAVAVAAATMVAVPAPTILRVQATGQRILLLVGAGGNGGDALYAGAELAANHTVEAVLLGREGRVHERALTAFQTAGGTVLDGLPEDLRPYRLVVDGILGIGGAGGLGPELGSWLERVREHHYIPVLAVDVPSGVEADTGALPEHHVTADVTVTFGALRHAHAVSPACGEVIIAEIGLGERTLSRDLLRHVIDNDGSYLMVIRAVPAVRYDWPPPLQTLSAYSNNEPLEPGAADDKYSGGVVGLCAGSVTYPGAAVLTVLGAVRATSAMVRYVGSQKLEVVRAVPEVVVSDTVADTGRVQAWVVGPGRGTDDAAHDELAELLERPEPLLIDADALTLLSRHPELREKLRKRTGSVLLTPHEGEFRRLAESLEDTGIPDPTLDRLGAVRALSDALNCGVLLKGRYTVLSFPGTRLGMWAIDAGSSWAATPGSGDVLAGVIGAWLARAATWAQHQEVEGFPIALLSACDGLQVHAMAAWLSAQTPDGPAPTSASRIAEAIPQATARLKHPDFVGR
ncbi:bifunctional ADP-dependent NAD(P)H-hydrate dehydratase/NAD(P)H-hydrate epimerase [Corynebacterium hylobatis]|uniref:ADP-dependent (S)-NAD(P)H-hydrate dehydratase n=1 Tax=Corynebacterium hylobatis TaxID=1859290 RepID=A0A430HVR8_9CORY|nr:bifunctional ADP-dependent NAD(P)H-hydrate dehydratase/NAD(P)H-hydrate epimerase [Corynebacterium hylobatis]RSZ61426.1 bifunctional ADP-dependent NAD(P)H-hydrate dehydratase/NAD(P)H-hydrate epimerase [Corynebacterium hylobatis]